MQRIQTFRVFESRVTLTEEQETWLNKCTTGSWSLNPAGEVDVEGDFDCSEMRLWKFKEVRFGRVSGDFKCNHNNISSLKGAPREVGGYFSVYSNVLTSLVGSPQKVGKDFTCADNDLTSLEGAPREVRGEFRCLENYKITDLGGAPEIIGGMFKSDNFTIPAGQWGPKGWLDAYMKGNETVKDLVLTLMNPDVLNKRMQEAPEQTIIDLGPVWNDPVFAQIRAQIRVPDRYRDEMGLLGDLGELGF